MSIINIPTSYYKQFDADYSLDIPAEGYQGWAKEPLPLNTETTAIVVMHAWDCGTYEQYPGWYRAVEYIPRSRKISQTVFPGLLSAARRSGMKVFHVVAGANGYYKKYEGYKLACSLTKEADDAAFAVDSDEAFEKLTQFKAQLGSHNSKDIERGFDNINFLPDAMPEGNEGVAENAKQLYALCRHFGINHLIYIGFAIDWCLLLSGGGMQDMKQRGLMCSAIRDAVTAVENRATARNELCKEIGLWRVALLFGYVYESQDIIKALK